MRQNCSSGSYLVVQCFPGTSRCDRTTLSQRPRGCQRLVMHVAIFDRTRHDTDVAEQSDRRLREIRNVTGRHLCGLCTFHLREMIYVAHRSVVVGATQKRNADLIVCIDTTPDRGRVTLCHLGSTVWAADKSPKVNRHPGSSFTTAKDTIPPANDLRSLPVARFSGDAMAWRNVASSGKCSSAIR